MSIERRVDRFIAAPRPTTRTGRDAERLLPGTLPFVTLANESGAGGHAVAEALVEALDAAGATQDTLRDWRVFDKAMCEHILEDERLTESVTELLDESYHSQIDEFVSGILGRGGMQNVAYVRLSRLIRTVASVGKVIVVGHGGFMATRELPGRTALRLIAPLPVRAERKAPTLGVDATESARLIARHDNEQSKLLKTHYRIDNTDPALYDLVANTEHLSPSTIAELIVTMLRRRID